MSKEKTKVKIGIITYGCSLNISDSEQIVDNIDKEKYELTKDKSLADILIINTCTVKTPTDNKIINKLKELKKTDKKLILTGCLVQSQEDYIRKEPLFENISYIGTSQFDEINKILSCDKRLRITSKKNISPIKSFRFDNHRLILPISRGCLGNCSYCLTKKARGDLYSYSPNEILTQINKAIKDGVKEIWLTSEDSFVYGLDKDYKLSNLLEEIDKIDENFMVRLGMGNPRGYLLQKEEIIKSINIIKNSNKFYDFLHIPIQSANNRVLKLMNRGYTKKNLYELFDLIKQKNFTISTDVICGFSSETELEFQETIDFINDFNVDVLNVSRFWPRPNTTASKMHYDGRITKKRSRTIKLKHDEISKKYYSNLIGSRSTVFVNEISKNALLCRDSKYRLYVISLKDITNNLSNKKINSDNINIDEIKRKFMGKKLLVNAYDAKTHYVYAKIIEEFN